MIDFRTNPSPTSSARNDTQFSDQKQGVDAFSRHLDAIARLKKVFNKTLWKKFAAFCVQLFRAGLWVNFEFRQ